MDAIIVFERCNDHPLRWLLDQRQRHVWCALRDEERDVWISYNWRKGLPELRSEAQSDFPLAQYYRDKGFDVVEAKVSDTPKLGLFCLNNCVGHTKVIIGNKSWAVTPRQLYRHLIKEQTMWATLRALTFFPGFGGGSSPAPLPAPAPPSRSDADIQTAALEARQRRARATGRSETILTTGQGVTEETTSPTKKLLGA